MPAKSSMPFDSDAHLSELKRDGTRCIAFIDRKGIRLQNRRLVFRIEHIKDDKARRSALFNYLQHSGPGITACNFRM
jgi:hypothetical protein